jgi:HEAT repeat protein
MSTNARLSDPRSLIRPYFQLRVGKLMVLVAVCAVFISAWQFRHDNADVERSMTSQSIRALSENDKARRLKAIEGLAHAESGDLFRVVAALAGALANDERPLRSGAARSLGSAIAGCIGSGSNAIGAEIDLGETALIQAFGDPHAEVRLEAVRAIGSVRSALEFRRAIAGIFKTTVTLVTNDGRASAPLVRLMHDSDPQVRTEAVKLFAKIGPSAGSGPEPVLDVFDHDLVPMVRAEAAGALVTGWPDPDRLYPLFLGRVKDVTDPDERDWIGWALGSLPPPPLEMVPALIDALGTDDFSLRRTIPLALAKLGPFASGTLPALAKAAERDFANVQGPSFGAAEAIATIALESAEGHAVVEQLVTLLQRSTDAGQWIRVAAVLEAYGPSASAAVPALCEGLRSTDENVRQQAAHVLGLIGPAAQRAIQKLSALRRGDPAPYVREAAAGALKRIAVENGGL